MKVKAWLAILIACIIGFLLQGQPGTSFNGLFSLYPLHTPWFEPWQVVTYAFLHGDMVHLFFNMFALYMFGQAIEELLGTRRFLVYYFTCVITAAAAQLVVTYLLDSSARTVGASGGVFGLLLAYGVSFPRQKLMLIFPPIPMPAWLFVTLYGLLELYLGLFGRGSNVAHFAHLGGMAGGIVLLLYWRVLGRGRRR
jgi:membrane associated rhomboid family serine protease